MSSGAQVRHDRDGDDPINRLLRRDLVYDLGPSHRYALYADGAREVFDVGQGALQPAQVGAAGEHAQRGGRPSERQA